MNILHIKNISDISTILAKEQRKLGHNSNVFDVFFDRPYTFTEYKPDFSVSFKHSESKFEKMARLLKTIKKEKLYDYDLFHLHCNGSLFAVNNYDVPLLKLFGKKIVSHYAGDEIRYSGERFLLKHLSDQKLVSTPDLLEHARNAEWLPSPVELEKLKPEKTKEYDSKIRIIQSARMKWSDKGVAYTHQAVKKLRNEGYDVELKILKNIPHQKVIKTINQSDIVVHSVSNDFAAWYGVFACEAMALEKPVCTTIDEKLESFLPRSHPIINVNKHNIYQNLKMLVEDKSLRKKQGSLGRKYVEKCHDSKKVAKKLQKIYDAI